MGLTVCMLMHPGADPFLGEQVGRRGHLVANRAREDEGQVAPLATRIDLPKRKSMGPA